MIWDFIRDFLVQYIFGGYDSNGDYFYGSLGLNSNGDYNDVYFEIGKDGTAGMDVNNYMCLGDWLSTTATIIIMCLIVFLLICLVRWIFRAVSSAMLLK